MESASKICSACLIKKPETSFSKDGDRLRSKCKECSKEYHRRWTEQNAARVKSYHEIWRANNKEKCLAWVAKWHAKNSERFKLEAKAWRERNPEKATALALKTSVAKIALLKDSYLAQLLEMPVDDCPPDLLGMKRDQVSLKRITKQLTEALNETTKGETK